MKFMCIIPPDTLRGAENSYASESHLYRKINKKGLNKSQMLHGHFRQMCKDSKRKMRETSGQTNKVTNRHC